MTIWRTNYNSTQRLYKQLTRPENTPSYNLKPAWEDREINGGLWFSRIEDGKSQWQLWCEDAQFAVRANAFELYMDIDSSKLSNLLTISKHNSEIWMPYVDFQKGYTSKDELFPTDIRWYEIGQKYDGVIIEYNELYYNLYRSFDNFSLHIRYLFSGWDVDTLCYWGDIENIYKAKL